MRLFQNSSVILNLNLSLCCSFTRPQIRGARPISDKLFSNKKCLAWFHEYAGADKVVGPEAMEKFCEDIGVEPENVSLFTLPVHDLCPSLSSVSGSHLAERI